MMGTLVRVVPIAPEATPAPAAAGSSKPRVRAAFLDATDMQAMGAYFIHTLTRVKHVGGTEKAHLGFLAVNQRLLQLQVRVRRESNAYACVVFDGRTAVM